MTKKYIGSEIIEGQTVNIKQVKFGKWITIKLIVQIDKKVSECFKQEEQDRHHKEGGLVIKMTDS